MNPIVKLAVVAAFGAACAACSHGGAPTQTAKAPAAAASSGTAPAPAPMPSGPVISMVAPASGASSSTLIPPPAGGPTLTRLMQRPAFAKAFDAMDGASALPAWTRQGGVALPSRRVEVDGKPMWLTQTCRSKDCETGQLLVLVDSATHLMHGVFVKASGSADAHVQQLTWLGKPDAAVRSFLKQRLSND